MSKVMSLFLKLVSLLSGFLTDPNIWVLSDASVVCNVVSDWLFWFLTLFPISDGFALPCFGCWVLYL